MEVDGSDDYPGLQFGWFLSSILIFRITWHHYKNILQKALDSWQSLAVTKQEPKHPPSMIQTSRENLIKFREKLGHFEFLTKKKRVQNCSWLAPTHLKKMLVKLGSFPQGSGWKLQKNETTKIGKNWVNLTTTNSSLPHRPIVSERYLENLHPQANASASLRNLRSQEKIWELQL